MASNSPVNANNNSSRLWNVPIQNVGGDANYFDSSRFRTCCGCHVRTFAFVIGLLETIALLAAVLATSLSYVLLWKKNFKDPIVLLPFDHHASLSLMGSLISLLVGAIAVALLFFGLAKERPSFLIPHLIVQFLAIIGLLAAVVVFVYVAAVSVEEGTSQAIRNLKINQTLIDRPKFNENQQRQHDRKNWPHIGTGRMFVYSVIISSLCLLASVLQVYFLVGIYRAYSYFCIKSEEMKKQSGPVKLWSTDSSSFRGRDDSVIAARIWSEV